MLSHADPPPRRYVANVFEELDAPGEYFFDPAAGRLYVFYNATSGTPPPSDFTLVATQASLLSCVRLLSLPPPRLPAPVQLEVFFNLTGNVSAPVEDVTFAGLAFRDQAPGQLEQWHDPSGGDWGLRR